MNDGQHADLSLNAGKWSYSSLGSAIKSMTSLKLSDLVDDVETTD